MSKKEKEIKETSAAPAETETSEKEAVEAPKKKKNFKKLKFGSMSAVMIVLVLAIVVVINIMAGILMKRYPIKLDLTPDNRYELTDDTIDILAKMDKDVEITVTSTRDYFTQMSSYFKNMYYQQYGMVVDMPFDIIPEMLERYSVYAESGSGKIKVSYADINKNPEIVSELGQNYNGEITEGSIVFRCGDRVKVITSDQVMSMVAPSQNSTSQSLTMTFGGESLMTSAIQSVTDMAPVRAAIVGSMNGSGIFDQTHASIVNSFKKFLVQNGYECTEIDAAADDISPEDYDLLVVAAPAIDFTQDIVAKFSDFLYNGGDYGRNMIYVPNFYATDLPNISEFLADWKINVDTAYVNDDNYIQTTIAALQNIDYSPILSVSDSESVGTLPNAALPIAAPGARTISVLDINNDSIVKVILKSSDTAYQKPLIEGAEVAADPGQFNVVVKSRKEVGVDFGVYGSELLVIGSPFMLDSAIIGSPNTYNNASAVLNIINNMTGKENGVIIQNKALQQSNLTLTSASIRVIQIVVIIVIPLLIAITGAAVLIWRKNK